MARTVLQLGAELIGSDGIAFYELIKNAFDARSPRVDIDVVVRLPHELYASHVRTIDVARLKHPRLEDFSELKAAIAADIDRTSIEIVELEAALGRVRNWDDLLDVLDSANFIEFRDTGSGMSLEDLDDKFLTIGTRSRLIDVQEHQDDKDGGKPVLGEKGLGRLSAMRLGSRLRLKSSRKGERNWNVLNVDWRLFSHESTALVEEIPLRPEKGPVKKNPDEHGTSIRIFGLKANWSASLLAEVASSEFSRLTDPFTPKSRYPIALRFNDQTVPIPTFDKLLFKKAHAVVRAEYEVTGSPCMAGRIDYVLRSRQKTFSLDLPHIFSVTGCAPEILRSLGPFSVEFYWFNRRILEAVEGIGDKEAVQGLVNRWSGGLMVFRDGFRVNPYGNRDDDWLDLDRRALASAGYKVNRKQIIGRVLISRASNPQLLDQTNREGIRDSNEKRALIGLLKHILEAQFRTFLNEVDDELRARLPATFDDLNERIQRESSQVRQAVRTLIQRHPEVRKDTGTLDALEFSLVRIDQLIRDAEQLAESFEKGRGQLVNLAALGLMVEILAHELNRATHHALSTIAETDSAALSAGVGSQLSTLKAQLKTLQKRLKILDPLSHSGRQVKESFDLVSWTEEIISAHEAQFRRHGIKCIVTVEPAGSARELQVRMVKGMVVQILENLISNSVYWLKQQHKLDKRFMGKINIVLDANAKELRLTDNGPGVPPERAEEVFQPFVTTKPPGEGKGLGLYISREIAHYHGATLRLSDRPSGPGGHLNTFILALGTK